MTNVEDQLSPICRKTLTSGRKKETKASVQCSAESEVSGAERRQTAAIPILLILSPRGFCVKSTGREEVKRVRRTGKSWLWLDETELVVVMDFGIWSPQMINSANNHSFHFHLCRFSRTLLLDYYYMCNWDILLSGWNFYLDGLFAGAMFGVEL